VPAGPAVSRRALLLGGATAAVGALAAACRGESRPAAGRRAAPPTSLLGHGRPATTSTSVGPPGPPSLAPGEPATFASRGPAAGRRVALTFHTDGDPGLDQELLDRLGERGVRMTAFVVGRWLEGHPDWAARLAGAGHELANHTYSHPAFTSLSPPAMLDEVERCRDLLVRLAGGGGTFFRPSGTDDGTAVPPEVVQEVAARAGYPVVLGFDVDPLDYRDPAPATIVARTLGSVGPGSVVSLHCSHAGTVAALPGILDGLAARDLVPVTASELFGYA
jgi:peptidoglycan/xylan/chitin deacetylase (PgdA/CDA1 family)